MGIYFCELVISDTCHGDTIYGLAQKTSVAMTVYTIKIMTISAFLKNFLKPELGIPIISHPMFKLARKIFQILASFFGPSDDVRWARLY
jgi:hypothetical protein